jgi:hypothetical protein
MIESKGEIELNRKIESKGEIESKGKNGVRIHYAATQSFNFLHELRTSYARATRRKSGGGGRNCRKCRGRAVCAQTRAQKIRTPTKSPDMAAQELAAFITSEGKLCISYTILGEPRAMSIQVATDIEFTKNAMTYVVPPYGGAELDVGSGAWYFRVGSWFGSEAEGKIVWTPVCGPATVTSLKPPFAPQKAAVPVLHTQAIMNGLRLHTGLTKKVYAVMEYSRNPAFPASQTHSIYAVDHGRGYFDCIGLEPTAVYSVRVATFEADVGVMPTDRVGELCAFTSVHGKRAARPIRPSDNVARSTAVGDVVLLREARIKPNMRFSSHSDYLRFLGAQARTSEKVSASGVGETR